MRYAVHDPDRNLSVPIRRFDDGTYIVPDLGTAGAERIGSHRLVKREYVGPSQQECRQYQFHDQDGRPMSRPYRVFHVWRRGPEFQSIEICPMEDMMLFAEPWLPLDWRVYDKRRLENAIWRTEERHVSPDDWPFIGRREHIAFWDYLHAIEEHDERWLAAAGLDPEAIGEAAYQRDFAA